MLTAGCPGLVGVFEKQPFEAGRAWPVLPAGFSGWGGMCTSFLYPPRSWLPPRSSSFLVAPQLPPACLRVRDFAVASSLPACVSRRGCFHFYSRKQQIPSASATAGVRQPPGSCCLVRCFVGSGCSASHGPNCCHSGSRLSPGAAQRHGNGTGGLEP